MIIFDSKFRNNFVHTFYVITLVVSNVLRSGAFDTNDTSNMSTTT